MVLGPDAIGLGGSGVGVVKFAGMLHPFKRGREDRFHQNIKKDYLAMPLG